ncbi:50S ribosomal protein L35ae [Nanoarchaeota archaeon]
MEATIVNFRGGRHTQKDNYMILSISGVADKEKAAALVGKNVVFETSAGNKITGQIKAAHGNSGAVRAKFEKGMPGQSLGQKVKIE